MIDRKVFNRQIAILAEIHRHELSEPVIDEYYLLLTLRMTTDQFVRMARRLEMSPKAFWPLPGEFLPPVHERLGATELEAQAKAEGLTSGQPVTLLPRGAA